VADCMTGGSSGIGRAAALLLAAKGAIVLNGDIHPPLTNNELASNNPSFIKTDVTSWESQLALFKETIKTHGRLDVVLANAGIDESEQAFEDKIEPESGDPVEPKWLTLNVNLVGSLITTKLALHFMRKSKEGGSIVLTGSRASEYEGYRQTTCFNDVLQAMGGM
jgi:NAD(P)-dependent dehydrogenase (short-subunit alcohol dehydrogenase family)